MEQNTSWPGRERLAARWGRRRSARGEGRHPLQIGWLAPAAVLATALILAACGGSPSGYGVPASAPLSAAAPSGSSLKTMTINGATVLTNAQGFTFYSFAPDTMTTSKCTGGCTQIWPPVKGPVTARPGVTGKLGTIKRPSGDGPLI
jgi:predicted lipoprotein with Yx(FWY)xxD motif